MIYRILHYLLKPEYLILNPYGAIHLDYNLNLINLYQNPTEFHQTLVSRPKPLRIVIDSYNQDYTKLSLPTQHFWQQYQSFKLPANEHNNIYFTACKNHIAHILRVHDSSTLNDWLNTINSNRPGIISVESIVFGLSCIAKNPQLYLVPDRFNQLRLIFVDGQGGIFCRFLNHADKVPSIIELQRTIHYVCREFAVIAKNIEVIATFQCPEIQPAMKSWQYIPIAAEHSERYLISLLTVYHGHHQAKSTSLIEVNKFKFFWLKLFQPVVFVATIIMTITNSLNYYQNHNLQQKIDYLCADNQLRQQEFDAHNYQTMQNTYHQLQVNNQPYRQALATIHDPLILLRRLSQTEFLQPIMTHLVYIKTSHMPANVRLLLEFKVNSEDRHSHHFDSHFKHYIDFLYQQFKDAKLTIDHGNHTLDHMSDDVTLQASPTSIVIQIDRIKL